MKYTINLFFILCLTFSSCDCRYQLSGVVLDQRSGNPIESVAIGKTDTADLDNPFNRKTITTKNGSYEISGVAGSCNEITMYFTKTGYTTEKITLQNNSTDTIFLQPTSEQKAELFDLNKDFDIVDLQKSNDYPSSDTDTAKCEKWTLSKAEIKKIINESKPINGPEWHHLFGHYPCSIDGILIQNSAEYDYSINSGAWLTISSSDTTLMFGSFKEENNKYFLDSAWSEEEMEGNE
ncbi:carboxypeptidase-like regulatory domain-containing protein [Mangrovivirga sp. M17]|uniref:Carboxypeptidase-like regulatory domain-containing protein n=1 Tax=Mangrovivirga halotolerans TaxID=2993936 RepID=A0ABT3RVD7_9BACT|nr:carboxypeptidase-like regulatory domain-containing protein [Mangrovivirga halotolerans]MCX2745318.1 carboxypeptidase-like regulatory domain-containing protein [Mangrovivirga halotolerans]